MVLSLKGREAVCVHNIPAEGFAPPGAETVERTVRCREEADLREQDGITMWTKLERCVGLWVVLKAYRFDF